MIDVAWPTHVERPGWLGSELSKERVSFDLEPQHLATLRDGVAAVRAAGTPLLELTREDFADPGLDDLLRRAATEVKQGAGLAFVRGVPVDQYSADDLRLIFWGLSTAFGRALSQSGQGDKLGEVVALPDAARGYTSDMELNFHCDLAEMFGLFCICPAKEGGLNQFASLLSVYEILLEESPQHLPILERGFHLDRKPDSLVAATEPITPYRVPSFSMREGLRSCWLTTIERAVAAADALGATLSPEELAALEAFHEILRRPGVAFEARLEPGEAVFVNNFEVVHARSRFVQFDEPERRRHLLRIWLQADPPRPMNPDILVYRNPSGDQGMDPIPGWGPGRYVRRDEWTGPPAG